MADDFGISLETRMQFDQLIHEGVDPRTVALFRADAEAMDTLEISAYSESETIRRETMQPYVQAKVHKRLAEAAEAILAYEQKSSAIEQGELAQLRRQIPQEPTLTEVQENTRNAKDLFVLGRLGTTLDDPLTLRLAYLQAVEDHNQWIIGAIERDPMARAQRILTPEDLARGREVRGLAAAPEVARKIAALEALQRTYQSRIRTALTRLRRGGWMPPDALVEMAAADTSEM